MGEVGKEVARGVLNLIFVNNLGEGREGYRHLWVLLLDVGNIPLFATAPFFDESPSYPLRQSTLLRTFVRPLPLIVVLPSSSSFSM